MDVDCLKVLPLNGFGSKHFYRQYRGMSGESGWQGKPGWVAEISAELRFEFVMFVQDGGLECGHTATVSLWQAGIV